MTRDDASRSPDPKSANGRRRPSLRGRLWAWIDQRTGADRILRATLDEPIPGGARFAYVFGSALLFIFVSQIVTGICLALYYVPAPMVAHVSVAYIVKEVAAGSFLRSLHSYGSSAMVVVLGLHLLQTLLYGSYKGKREFLWMSGCALLLLVLGMAFTGYLLPWDQKAYFAGSVGTDIVGQVPLVGESLRRLLRGGATMGALTISRFYVLHVLIIPGLILALIATHVALFRKAGAAGPANVGAVTPNVPAEMFYPRQVLIDMAFVLLIMGVLGMLAHFVPVTLGPEANPTDSRYLPRPEWYFVPMFQWLKYWEGGRTVIGIVIIPAILIVLMFLLPFMDRGPERRPWRRPIPVGGVFIVLGGLWWLGMTSHLNDSRDPAVAAQLAQQNQQESAYSLAAFQPYAASSSSGAAGSPPLDAAAAQGKTVFDARCSSCHGAGGVGGRGPALTQIARQYQPAQLTALLRAPTAKMTAAGMVAVAVSGDDMTALVSYVTGLGGGSAAARGASPPAGGAPGAAGAPPSAPATAEPSAAGEPPPAGTGTSAPLTPAGGSPAKAMPGETIYQAQGCTACHGVGGTGTTKGPDLTKLTQTMTPAALTNVLQHPTDKMHAGGMPPVQATGADLSALVAYVRSFATPETAPTPATTAAGASPSSVAPVASHQVDTIASPRAMTESEAKGKVVFEAHGCAKCHGTGGVAGTAAAAGLAGAVRTSPALLATMLRHPTALMQRGGMPPVSLSDADLQALVAYVSYISVLTPHPR